MTTTRINVITGIYDTEYTIRDYGSHIIVTEPFVNWHNNTGSLDFRKIRCDDPGDMAAIRIFAERDSLGEPANNGGEWLSLSDVLEGNRSRGVHVIS